MSIQWLLQAVQFVQRTGQDLQEAWPSIQHMIEDAKKVLEVFNKGKPLTLAGGPSTPEGVECFKRLKAAGVPEDEAKEACTVAEAAGQFVS